MNKKLCAIILAAGEGKRLGGPKIYNKLGPSFFPELICDKLADAGIENITIVTFTGCEVNLFKFPNKVKWAFNPNPETGMITSVYLGVQANKECDGFLIIPVDHPLIKSETFTQIKNEFLSSPEKIIKVKQDERAGHPVVIPSALAMKIENKDLPGGLNKLIELNNIEIKYIEVEDPGTVQNINTADDYKKFIDPKGNPDG